ncbi:hypothetical protein [Streptomyces sp. NPDC000618]|uniref:hypothetical protein n=1 Tax=Streptomyces sp. NPDC000618 TaxID=3154265 RepID=UPI0033254124
MEGAALARADPRARGGLQLGDRRGGQTGAAPGTRFLGNRTDQMLSDAERTAREE